MADHVAVRLFAEGWVARLTVFSPCAWDSDACQFVDTGSADWRNNPGRIANKHHRNFSRHLGTSSLEELEHVRLMGKEGAMTMDCTSAGFHARNNLVASKAEYMIAFTLAPGDAPPRKGGTRYTWNRCKAQKKLHISLASAKTNHLCSGQ